MEVNLGLILIVDWDFKIAKSLLVLFVGLDFFFYLFCECFSTRRTCRLTCSIICTDGNVYSSVKYSYSSILIHENADIFAAALLISHYSFSAKIVSSVVVITFSILSKTMHLKHGLLSAGKIVSFTKKKNGFAAHFLKRFIKFLKSY